MTFVCYDSIHADKLPSGAPAYLAYIDGLYANYDAVKGRFPDATIIGVTVFGNKALMADDESGDMTNSQIASWFPGDEKTYNRPILYTSASNMDALVADMSAAGDNRDAYRLWSAHYGWPGGAHICGPSTCGACQVQCDATQWASNSDFDTSLLSTDFFGVPVTARWELWTCAGEESAMQMANGAGLKVSTWLRMQLVLGGGEFSTGMSGYLGGGSLRANLPKGLQVWALVKK